jgi:tRNA(adenine34) deaminase
MINSAMLAVELAGLAAASRVNNVSSLQAEAQQDAFWMDLALAQARAADAAGEVPVGAVLVCDGQVIAAGRNAPIATHDPTAHAEINALRAGAQRLGNYRLENCEMFVTLEPCSMCAGAMLQARLKRVVFGAADPKTGSAGSVTNLFAVAQLNHHTLVQGGVQAGACAELLQDFFKRQRALQRLQKRQAGRALRDDALRTPEHCFADLPAMPAASQYVSALPALAGLRLHYLDSGATQSAQTQLCLHGPQDWCLTWRNVIRQGRADGHRVVCPDLIGFGKSDKPKKSTFHTWQIHADMVLALIELLNLQHVTLIAPDSMGGLTSLVLAGAPERITGARYIRPDDLTLAEREAPFPDAGHQAALRAFAALTNYPVFPAAAAINR